MLEIYPTAFPRAVEDDPEFSSEAFHTLRGDLGRDLLEAHVRALVLVMNQSDAAFAVWHDPCLWGRSSDLADACRATGEDAGDRGLETFKQSLVVEQIAVLGSEGLERG